MNFSLLPSDVLDRILTSVPDFDTLSAVLQTSKSLFYDVFQHRPRSIVRSVAYNVVGPALPQAMRLIHHRNNMDDLNEVSSETDVFNLPFTRSMSLDLEECAEVAHKLQDLFSMR